MVNLPAGNRTLKYSMAIVLALLLLRLFSLAVYPLFDTTEARYGEIARIMFETQNWVTPQFDYNVPFWGKPPMHTWLSALSFVWFGVSEFTARLPHFVCGLLTLVLLYRFSARQLGQDKAWLTILVMSSSLGFIISIGMVMTESALLLATTLAMISFWHSYRDQSKFYGHLFFVALGFGMLIKGPVAVVFAVIALLAWSIWQGCLIRALKSLPWFTGMSLFLAVTLPWYIWAEIRSPGFFEYFIVGEHIQRFLVPGWEGDLYGSAHDEPKGKIWLFWLAAAFPWSFVVLALLARHLYRRKETKTSQEPLTPYLIGWMLSPMLLFTLSGNILSAYVLPGFSAMAVLLAQKLRTSIGLNLVAILSLVLLITALAVYSLGLTSKTAESELLGASRSFPQNEQLYYWQKRPFSARFYSKGQALLLDSEPELQRLLSSPQRFFLAISHTDYLNYQTNLLPVCTEQNRTQDRLLLRCH